MSDIPWGDPTPETAITTRTSKHRHVYDVDLLGGDPRSCRCGLVQEPAVLRRNRNNRKRGQRHEPATAQIYGGRPVGALKLPWDIEGEQYATQVKTHVGYPPIWWKVQVGMSSDRLRVDVYDGPGNYRLAPAPPRWVDLFESMRTASRSPRLLERYLPGQGRRPEDLMVVLAGHDPAGFDHFGSAFVAYLGRDWLDLFGKDDIALHGEKP